MNITCEISEDRSTLTLFADEETREELREFERYGIVEEAQTLADMLSNSELDWILPEETGDLTSAPLLGIVGSEYLSQASGPHGARQAGHWDGQDWYQPILERWGFAPYQLRSFLSDLADEGKAVFINHW